jgi:hypothetical protein
VQRYKELARKRNEDENLSWRPFKYVCRYDKVRMNSTRVYIHSDLGVVSCYSSNITNLTYP